MHIGSTTPRLFFTRQPSSALSKTATVTLFIAVVPCSFVSLFSHQLFIYSALLLLSATLSNIGIRWAPLLGSIVSGFLLYALLNHESFPLHHLLHPKEVFGGGGPLGTIILFIFFIISLLLLWSLVIACAAGVIAVFQSYVQHEQHTPPWFTKTLFALIGVLFGVILMAAIVQPDAAPAAAAAPGGEPTVHLGSFTFSQSAITIAKGSTLTLIDDGAYKHNLSNGSWVNGQPLAQSQPGAPTINNLSIDGAGKSTKIGPFTTAGVYHLYCSIHSGMNLTITVQ